MKKNVCNGAARRGVVVSALGLQKPHALQPMRRFPGSGGNELPKRLAERVGRRGRKPSAAVCMGAVSHPVHRIVQLGFMEAADDLGYEGHILGFDESSMQELFDCWLQGAEEHDIGGALCWVGDDSTYEFLKELHGMDVKIVVPHFPHSYAETKDFIDVNICHDLNETTIKAADYIGQTLRAKWDHIRQHRRVGQRPCHHP